MGPVVVGEEADILTNDEVDVLKKGPKFCIRRVLSKERYLVEQEKTYVKLRWANRGKEDDDEDTKNETEVEKIERMRVEKLAQCSLIRMR